MEPAVDTQAPASGTKAPANGIKATKARNVRYPVQLRVNITPEMNESLGRLARYWERPEGQLGREALKQFLIQHDPQFRKAMQESWSEAHD